MPDSLEKFDLFYEHQESPEEYRELVNRIPNEIASIVSPIFAGRLSK